MYDLHAHLTGSITGEGLFSLIYNSGVFKTERERINSLTSPIGIRLGDAISENVVSAKRKFSKLYVCRPNGTQRFDEIMQRFVLISYILGLDKSMLKTVGEIVAKGMENAGTNYVEWRIDPFSSTKNQTAEEGAEKLREFHDGLKKSSLDFRFIIGLAKHRYKNGSGVDVKKIDFAAEQTRKLLDECDDLPIVGLDAVNKEDVAIRDLKPFFDLSKSYNLGLSPHVGECTSDSLEENMETVTDALALGANRLGHAIVSYMPLDVYIGKKDAHGRVYDKSRIEVLTRKQEKLLEEIKDSEVPIEVCPTSNIVAHLGLKSIKNHPIDRLLDIGIPFVLCTDDYGIFGSPLKNEISELCNAKGLDKNALETAAKKYSFKKFGN